MDIENEIGKFGTFRKDYSWQEKSVTHFMNQLDIFYSSEKGQFERAFINEVSPSGGKTIFSMKLVRELITRDLVDRVIWCVPRDSIKLGFEDDSRMIDMPEGHRHVDSDVMCIDAGLNTGYRGYLRNFHGAVITYQALQQPNMLEYFDMLSSKYRLAFVFDEAHHGASGDEDASNIWGAAMEECRNYANTIMCMTGTPVRSDSRRIPFVDYASVTAIDDMGRQRNGWMVKSDFSFCYKDAVAAGIARKIICRNQDPTIAYEHTRPDGTAEQYERPLSTIPMAHLNKVKHTATCFKRGIVDEMLKIADDECKRQRSTGDADAAILVIGRRDLGESNSLDNIAQRILELFGETAVTVQSSDGQAARDRIKKFKNGTGRWIVAKEMISEGTNLPRLRSVVILRDIGNQTFYEQLVHRITRNDADDRPQDAIIVQLQLPKLVEWGASLEEQSNIGWELRKVKEREEGVGNSDGPKDEFMGISAELEDELVIIEGEDFSDVDPLGRKLHAAVGEETKTSRWQIDKILKKIPGLIGININEEELLGQENLITREEEFNRRRERAIKNCQATAKYMGGRSGDYARVINDCKRSAGIRGSIGNVIRDHSDPIAAIKRFEMASKRALSRIKNADQGTLL